MFREAGVPVWDADAAVHRLYAPGGAAVAPIGALYPGAILDGAVDRGALKAWIAQDPGALSAIERVVHPLVQADRAAFLAQETAPVVLCDIPLLYETGSERDFDLVVVVSAAPEAQRARVLARPEMTEAQFDTILARQMPDAEKRHRADVVIDSNSLASARADVETLMMRLRQETDDA